MIKWPLRNRALSLLTYAVSGVFFLWLVVEDRSLVTVTLLGVSFPIIFLVHFLLERFGGAELPMRKSLLLLGAGGTLAGALAPLTTAVLMAVKVMLHGHTPPDYSPEMVAAVIARLPLWSVAGLLVGAALAVWVFVHRPPP